MRLKILLEKLRISAPLWEEFNEFNEDWKVNIYKFADLSKEQQVILFKVGDDTIKLLRGRIEELSNAR